MKVSSLVRPAVVLCVAVSTLVFAAGMAEASNKHRHNHNHNHHNHNHHNHRHNHHHNRFHHNHHRGTFVPFVRPVFTRPVIVRPISPIVVQQTLPVPAAPVSVQTGIGSASSLVKRNGLTAEQLEAEVKKLAESGHRMVSIRGFELNGEQRFDGVWQLKAGGQSAVLVGQSAAEFQKSDTEMRGQGFRLVQVSTYRVGGQELRAAIWEA